MEGSCERLNKSSLTSLILQSVIIDVSYFGWIFGVVVQLLKFCKTIRLDKMSRKEIKYFVTSLLGNLFKVPEQIEGINLTISYRRSTDDNSVWRVIGC